MDSKVDIELIKETSIAIVQKASLVSKKAQKELLQSSIVSKSDLSPVTVLDYAIQAAIAIYITKTIKNQTFRMIAEEDSTFLRTDSAKDYLNKVTEYTNMILSPITVQSLDILQALDNCHYNGDITNDYWILDPIDGTKGFISNGQFAIGLAYTHQGIPIVGTVGAPNFSYEKAYQTSADWNSNKENEGCIVVGIKNQNTVAYDLFSTKSRVLHCNTHHTLFTAVTSRQAVNHTSTLSKVIKQCEFENTTLEIDSMCKYVAVAMGYVLFYFRENISNDYKENVWDHAAGFVILESAGGIITDMNGNDLDFTHGGKLVNNHGIVAASKEISQVVLNALHTL